MSANDKTGLGYDSQLSKKEIPKCEIFEIAYDSSVSEIDEDNNQAKDRYKVGIGYHAIPPPYTGNYMPPRADLSFAGLDDSVFKFKISETRTNESDSKDEYEDKTSTEQEISNNDNLVKSVECTKKYISEKHTNNHDENRRKRHDSRVDWNESPTEATKKMVPTYVLVEIASTIIVDPPIEATRRWIVTQGISLR
uniref:Uncharacterized protein n=1 Tax=Tanacetum cinerariifolium TaxID=118510 RepID=A0A699L3F6_TANCI|nr:hypothetical protein [Tanacetum cinerariifolium]